MDRSSYTRIGVALRSKPVCGFRRYGVVALLASVAGPTVTKAERLRSPWDSVKVTQSDVAYTCPAPPVFVKTGEIGSYYVDSHASVIDPEKLAAFQKTSAASSELSRSAALAADAYLDNGSRAAAACVESLLYAAAKAGAWSGKMPGFQGVYLQNWLLSAVAISYLKVRPSGVGTPDQDLAIQRWFGSLAAQVTTYFDAEVVRLGSDGENNHIYWAGLAVAAAGIADGNAKEFRWGVAAYRMGVHAIQPDGSLLAEMNRGQMALHYHLYALGPLILLAELGEVNGLDLYAEDKGAIHRLVEFCVAGLDDPSLLEKRTGVKQVVTLPYEGSDIGWAVPYVHRFPDPHLSSLLARAPWVRYTSWGGAPPE